MREIKLNGKRIILSDRELQLLNEIGFSLDEQYLLNRFIKIFKSTNYLEGKISYEVLKFIYTVDRYNHSFWYSLITSKNYGDGLISFNQIKQLASLNKYKNIYAAILKSKYYAEGKISPAELELMFAEEPAEKEINYLENIFKIMTEKIAKDDKISEEEFHKWLKQIGNEKCDEISSILIQVLTSENYINGCIKQNHLKMLFDEKIDRSALRNLLISRSYAEGKITEERLIWLQSKEVGTMVNDIVNILISDNYADGKVSEKDLQLLLQVEDNDSVLSYYQKQSIIEVIKSQNYAKGIISHEDLELILQTKELKSNRGNCPEHPLYLAEVLSESKTKIPQKYLQLLLSVDFSDQGSALSQILTSENYANGLISEQQIMAMFNIKNSVKMMCYEEIIRTFWFDSYNQASTFAQNNKYTYYKFDVEYSIQAKTYATVLTTESYAKGYITEEDLQLVLNPDYIVIDSIILQITNLSSITDKEDYIWGMLKIKNKEKIVDLYRNSHFKTLDEFSSWFVNNQLQNIAPNIIRNFTKKKTLSQNSSKPY